MGAVLAVIVTILKWIGIILLWILGIILGILILFLILLAVPIRIKAQGEYRRDFLEAEIHGSYLFRLIQVKAYIKDNALAWQMLLAGRRLAGSVSPVEKAAQQPEEEPDEAVFTEEEVQSKAVHAGEELVSRVGEPVVKAAKTAEKDMPSQDAEEIPRWARECMKPIGPNRWDSFWESIGAKLAGITDIWYEYKSYPNKQKIAAAVKTFLKRLAHSLRLRDSVLHVRFGFSDPSKTGLLLGVICAAGQFYTSRGCHLEADPDFEKACLEIAGHLKMHINLLSLIWITLRLAVNRDIFRLIRYVLRRKK